MFRISNCGLGNTSYGQFPPRSTAGALRGIDVLAPTTNEVVIMLDENLFIEDLPDSLTGNPARRASSVALAEDNPTTQTIGQEGDETTLAIGEEGDDDPTTLAVGEEGDDPTTLAVGEEGDDPTTLALGEEGDDDPTTWQ